VIREEVDRLLQSVAGRPGHIFNLGHGIHKETPVENAIALVEAVKDLSRR
jgi:uroporphyrinogen decarboxylase